MFLQGRSLFSINDLSVDEVSFLFDRAQSLFQDFTSKKPIQKREPSLSLMPKLVALVFLEPSTRTRISFEVACKRLGVEAVVLDSAPASSLSKGESAQETILNILATKPEALVFRASGGWDEFSFLEKADIPVINAGLGAYEHPTQALLDVFTIKKKLGSVEGKKVLFVGDVAHSRVVRSSYHLLKKMGASVGGCGPQSWLQAEGLSFDFTERELTTALEWCDVVVGLRIQQERHGDKTFDIKSYIESYCLTSDKLKALGPGGLILHPGPFVSGVDLSPEVLEDSRCSIRDQVTYGVWVRAALLESILLNKTSTE